MGAGNMDILIIRFGTNKMIRSNSQLDAGSMFC